MNVENFNYHRFFTESQCCAAPIAALAEIYCDLSAATKQMRQTAEMDRDLSVTTWCLALKLAGKHWHTQYRDDDGCLTQPSFAAFSYAYLIATTCFSHSKVLLVYYFFTVDSWFQYFLPRTSGTENRPSSNSFEHRYSQLAIQDSKKWLE